ncbi:hypothetical protein PHABIO_73 [Pseudomonas phage Phabio]|uniref:Uncharacterized protein n=1 Tax=Pseudomonas phage Phabio TaxID=2006668 RepID=A0A1Y0SVW1_9CAUD|nr:hypothetical protein MZD05_gp073 [Pseudomonas phage Phabio]ARV76704.1 hypothetical protein PHABIO_73 [Pseudomonas phage Phabio]
MTELVKVVGDFLYRQGDPCEFVINKANALKPPFVLGQRYKGTIQDKDVGGYYVLPEIKHADGSRKNVYIDGLEIILDSIVFDVLATKEEIFRRINNTIDGQEKLIKEKYTSDMEACTKGRNLLMSNNKLIGD